MIGILDSGLGGENTLREVRRIYPRIDVLLLCDTANAPYGTKSEDTLVKITEKNIERLASLGAQTVLIACCTASTVWEMLREDYRRLSVPIIEPIAERVRRTVENGRVALIATERTVSSHAFEKRLPEYTVRAIAAQRLVSFVESGERDGHVGRECLEYLDGILSPLAESRIDTVILGCTHFPSLEKTILKTAEKYGIKNTVSSSQCAAHTLLHRRGLHTSEMGVTVRI